MEEAAVYKESPWWQVIRSGSIEMLGPGKGRRQRQAIAEERRRCDQLEDELAQARAQLKSCNGYHSTPIYRQHVTAQYDWNCQCGRINYAGRFRCFAPHCNLHRQHGATIIGQVRGIPQNTPAAIEATRRQQAVPVARRSSPSLFQRTSPAVVRNASASDQQQAPLRPVGLQHRPQTTTEQAHAPPKTYSQAAQAAGRASEARQPVLTAEAVQQSEHVDASHPPREDPEDADLDDEVSVTLQEDADAGTLQRRLRGLEKRRGKQLARIGKQEATIIERREVVARQQAELVELQNVLDSTRENLRETDELMAELSGKLAELTAQRARADCQERASAAAVQQSSSAEEARNCLLSALIGLQTFTDQPPEFQVMLRQFATAVERMQEAEKERSVEPHLAPPHTPGDVSAPPARFDIHTSPATPTGLPVPAPSLVRHPADETMGFDETSSGEKRKFGEVDADLHSAAPSTSPVLLAITDAPAAEVTVCPAEDTGVVNASSRKDYLDSLRTRVAEQAAQARREARSTPYGHG